MCNQPDDAALKKAFDDAPLKLFWEWAALEAEYIDGDDVGPQDWDAEFLKRIVDRLPEVKKARDYARLTRLLDALAAAVPEPCTAQGSPSSAVREGGRPVQKSLCLPPFGAHAMRIWGLEQSPVYPRILLRRPRKIKLSIRKAYGYRELKVAEIAIYHALGKLPEPELIHRFC